MPDIVRALEAQGARVRVLALSRRDGRAIARLDAGRVGWRVSPAPAKGHLRAAAWLLRELRGDPPDLIWTSLTQATVIGQLAGRALGIPVVSWQHNAFLKPANVALLFATRRLTKWWVSDSVAVAELTSLRLHVPPSDVLVWPLFRATLDAPVARPWRPGDVYRFGSAGRLHPNKGYDVLIAAAARLEQDRPSHWPAFSIDIFGEGAARSQLERQIAQSGVRSVRLPGFQADTPSQLAQLHAYVQPSRAEGLCIAAHEAMAAGLPVIASAVGEMPRSVRDGEAGTVVAPEDVGGLQNAMAAMLNDPRSGCIAGLKGRALVLDRYSERRFAEAGAAVLARAQTEAA